MSVFVAHTTFYYFMCVIDRAFLMSAHVLMNLFNEFGKRDAKNVVTFFAML